MEQDVIATPAEQNRKPGRSSLLDENGSVEVMLLLHILRKSWKTVLRAGCGMLILSMIIAFVIPAQYHATASLVPPNSNSSSGLGALAGQLSALGAGGLAGAVKNPSDLYVGILKSRSVASELVRQFNLKAVYKVKKESQAENELAGHTTFEVGTKDSIITIGVTDHSPERARDLANAYLEALRTANAGLALTESSQRRLFFENRLMKEKNELANAEVALKQSEEKTGMIAPVGQTASKIQAIAQLRAQIASRRVRLASMLRDETDQNPDVIRMQSEISNLEQQVAQMEKGKDRDGEFGAISNAQVPTLELEYIRRAREVKYHEALFEIIARQYEAARLDEARESPLQVLDRAVLPDSKSGPSRALLVIIGFLAGLFGGGLWVLFQALWLPEHDVQLS